MEPVVSSMEWMAWVGKLLKQWHHKRLLSVDDTRVLLAIADVVVNTNEGRAEGYANYGQPNKAGPLCLLCSYTMPLHGPIKMLDGSTVACPFKEVTAY